MSNQFSASFLYEAIDKVTPVLKDIAKMQKKLGVTIAKTRKKINKDIGKSNTIYVKHEKIVKKTTKNIIKSHKEVSKSTDAFGKIKNIGSEINTKVALPFIAGTTAMIMAGSKFEQSLKDLQSITGVSNAVLGTMKGSIMEASNQFNIGSSQISKGMELIGSKQPILLEQPKLLLEVAKASMTMSKASGIAFEQTSDDLLSVMNTFDIAGKDAMKTVNLLGASSKYGASQVAYVTSAMKNAGSASKLAKVDMGELVSAIQIVSEKTGLASERVGTGLKTAFIRLEKQGIKKLKPSVVGLETALRNLNAMGMDTKKMTALLGEEAITSFPALIKNADAFAKMNKKIRGTSVAQEQATIRMNTFKERMKSLYTIIENGLIKAFDILQPVLESTLRLFVGMAKIVVRFVENNKTLVKILFLTTAGVVALGVALTAIGSAGMVFITMRTSMALLSPIITAMTTKYVAMGMAMKGIGAVGSVVGVAMAGWTLGKLLYEIPVVKKFMNDVASWLAETTNMYGDKDQDERGKILDNERARLQQKRKASLGLNKQQGVNVNNRLDVKVDVASKDYDTSTTSKLRGTNPTGKSKAGR